MVCHCFHQCCIPLWIILGIAGGLLVYLDLIYCWHFPYIAMNIKHFLAYLSINVLIGNIVLGCLYFLLMTKCGCASKFCGVFKCIWLIVHIILAISTIAFLIWMRSSVIYGHVTMSDNLRGHPAGQPPEWLCYTQKNLKCCGINDGSVDTCLKRTTNNSLRGCQPPLLHIYAECYTYSLYFSIIAAILGLIPFVVFTLVHREYQKDRRRQLAEEATNLSSTTMNEERLDFNANSRQFTHAKVISNLMAGQSEIERRKFGAAYVSDINAPIQYYV